MLARPNSRISLLKLQALNSSLECRRGVIGLGYILIISKPHQSIPNLSRLPCYRKDKLRDLHIIKTNIANKGHNHIRVQQANQF